MTITPLNLQPANTNNDVTHKKARRNWRILVVDDEKEIHAVTRMILRKMQYKERSIELLSAYSATEAKAILTQEDDIAVIFLDVVMESEDAGLQLVKFIREELENEAVRIILRTGQPGQAPEESVITDYDINDYKDKSELTAQKLFTTVVASLRSYETIIALEKNRKGLEKILESTNTLFQVGSLTNFASGVLMQLSSFLECQPNGIICLQPDSSDHENISPCEGLRILASSGEYSNCLNCDMTANCKHLRMVERVRKSMQTHQNQYTDEYTVIYLDTGDSKGIVALVHGGLMQADKADLKLLEVFSNKVSIAMANALNYQKMISAEQAATTDFLTNLDNRRQLLRLGKPLVAGAMRNNTPLAVAMLDIDYFKSINDKWGHDAGDLVLQRIALLMKERFRASDVIARFGGEEFCIIASGLSAEVAFDLFDGFRLQLEAESFEFSAEKVTITISIGVNLQVASDIDAMISSADALLYQAKSAGRNCIVIE